MKNLWQKFRQVDTNFLIAISAVVISLCALIVSFQEVRIMRQQQQVSMYPHLSLSQIYSTEGFAINLRNSGIGLAQINSVQVFDGERYYKNWLEIIEAQLPDSLQFGYEALVSNTVNKKMIIPGEEVTLFSVNWTPATRLLEQKMKEMTMTICYSSLLEEYWSIENDNRQQLSRPCKRIESEQFY
ncbi:MAG: hypothetical protein ACRBG0_20745 [Lewinella sp.]|uniref:hypothetical protein n=1 Tax=Lewinella sp. TaxID=2004506 RepID=UPI003D6BC01B